MKEKASLSTLNLKALLSFCSSGIIKNTQTGHLNITRVVINLETVIKKIYTSMYKLFGSVK